MILIFWMLSFKPTFSLSSSTFIKRVFSSSSLSVISVVSSACLRLLIFLPAILSPTCASSSQVFPKMFSAYKINKQGDNIQPWCTLFPIWNQSVVPCPFLTLLSDLHTDFSGVRSDVLAFPSLEEFSTVCCDPQSQCLWHSKWSRSRWFSGTLLLFFYDPTDVGNLIFGSSAFSKTSLNIWNFMVHVLLKPGLENSGHYFASVWDECSYAVA